jgi:Right handed beta helix region
MQRLIAALIISIIWLAPNAQPSSACLVAGSDIAASLADAQAGPRCLELPAGVYTLPLQSQGVYFPITVDNLEIRGAGVGKTIIQTQSITLTNHLIVFRTTAKATYIHDLTIQIGAGTTSPPNTAYSTYPVSAYIGATTPHFARLDISGTYGGMGAGGDGIDLYQPPGVNQGRQDGLVEDVTIHDSPHATGMIINSSGNTFRHNTIRDIGSTGLQHGFYIQGGDNTLENNLIERVGGWSIHGYKNANGTDGTGDRYINNTSLSPGAGHIIVSGNARYATITGNTLRGGAAEGISVAVPSLIANNQLDDMGKPGTSYISVGDDSVVSGNALSYTTNQGATYGIRMGGTRTLVTGNHISLGTVSGLIAKGPRNLITANVIRCGGAGWATCMQVNAPNNTFDGNLVTAFGGAQPWKQFGDYSGLQLFNNTMVVE